MKKRLMRTILFKGNLSLKLYVIFCILHLLIIFMNDEIVHSFLNKCKPPPTKFRKVFLCEDSSVSSVIFDVHNL